MESENGFILIGHLPSRN